jgi:cytochrome c
MKNSLSKLLGTLTILALISFSPLVLLSQTKEKSAKPSAEAKGSASDGQKIFQANCAMCHYADKTDKKLGPGLKDLTKNKELPASHKPSTEANIREVVGKGSPDAKPMPMPPFEEKLSADDMQDLLAYLKTL